MMRIIFLVLIVSFLSTQDTHALDLAIKAIDIKAKEAVLIDLDTDSEWVVQEGDEIEGTKVIKITENSVQILKKTEGDMRYNIIQTLTLPTSVTIKPSR